jgi:hypothetical protein
MRFSLPLLSEILHRKGERRPHSEGRNASTPQRLSASVIFPLTKFTIPSCPGWWYRKAHHPTLPSPCPHHPRTQSGLARAMRRRIEPGTESRDNPERAKYSWVVKSNTLLVVVVAGIVVRLAPTSSSNVWRNGDSRASAGERNVRRCVPRFSLRRPAQALRSGATGEMEDRGSPGLRIMAIN